MRPPRLVLLTDRHQLGGRDLVATVRDCARLGSFAVLLRELDLAPAGRAALARELAALLPREVPLLAARGRLPGTRGVHLAAHQPAPTGTGPWGRSCHRSDDVAAAAATGASWVTLSPFATSTSKPGHLPVLPAGAFTGHPVPVLALGGITPANAADALAAGAHGVAVLGAVMAAPDPAEVVAELLEVTGRAA